LKTRIEFRNKLCPRYEYWFFAQGSKFGDIDDFKKSERAEKALF
jgi:hypothetical protein